MNETDLRVIKTEQLIEQSFLALVQQKGYRSITVQDILDKALINRSTFYRHYPSKQALAEKLIEEFRQTYENFLHERFYQTSPEKLSAFLDGFMQFILGQKDKILALWQIKTPSIHLYDDMYEMVKSQYVQYAQSYVITEPQGNIDYQGHMYAVLVLNNLSYVLKHNTLTSLADIRHELEIMLATARIKQK